MDSTPLTLPGPDSRGIDRMQFFRDCESGGAWPFLVRGVNCLLNCDNGRDLCLVIECRPLAPSPPLPSLPCGREGGREGGGCRGKCRVWCWGARGGRGEGERNGERWATREGARFAVHSSTSVKRRLSPVLFPSSSPSSPLPSPPRPARHTSPCSLAQRRGRATPHRDYCL